MKPPEEACAVCGAELTDEAGWIGHQRLAKAWCYGKHATASVVDALGESVHMHTLLWRFPQPQNNTEGDR